MMNGPPLDAVDYLLQLLAWLMLWGGLLVIGVLFSYLIAKFKNLSRSSSSVRMVRREVRRRERYERRKKRRPASRR